MGAVNLSVEKEFEPRKATEAFHSSGSKVQPASSCSMILARTAGGMFLSNSSSEIWPSPFVSNELNIAWSTSILAPERFLRPRARKARCSSPMSMEPSLSMSNCLKTFCMSHWA